MIDCRLVLRSLAAAACAGFLVPYFALHFFDYLLLRLAVGPKVSTWARNSPNLCSIPEKKMHLITSLNNICEFKVQTPGK